MLGVFIHVLSHMLEGPGWKIVLGLLVILLVIEAVI